MKTKIASVFFVCLMTVVFAEEAPKKEQTVKERLERKITVEFTDTPVPECYEFLRGMAGVAIILDPNLFSAPLGGISAKVNQTSIKDVIEQVAKLAKAEVEYTDECVFVKAAGSPKATVFPENVPQALSNVLNRKVSFEFQDTPVVDGLEFIMSLTKRSLTIEMPESRDWNNKAVSLRVVEMRLGTALAWIAWLTSAKMEFKGDKLVFTYTKPETNKPEPKK